MRRTPFTLLACVFFFTQIHAQSYTFKHQTLPCLNKKFTIVAHVFKDTIGSYGVTETQIKQAVEGINTFFEPICASFEVCEVRYHENSQHDVLEFTDAEMPQLITQYHADRRINIYFVTTFTSSIGACGIASGTVADPNGSGIFIRKDCVNPGVIAHEMGHYFSLLHTFEGNGVELVNGANCTTTGDLICDTPADPYVPGDPLNLYLNGCLFISPKQDANGEYYNPDVGNIMSYYGCGSCGFTWGQYDKMAQYYLASGIKFW